MDTGTGLFCGLVILGVIYLYTQTKDRWNWKKIVFSMIGILLILLGIFWLSLWLPKQLTPNAGVDKPKLITSSDGISLGDTLADVEFKKGKLKTYQDFFKEKRDNYQDELYIIDRTFGVHTDIGGKFITVIVRACDSGGFTESINGISCDDSGEKIIERFGKDVVVKCAVNPDLNKSPRRMYDVSKYGVRYQLQQNKVDSFKIFPSANFLSESKNWEPCK